MPHPTTPHRAPTRARMLIAERGTDWLRALRSLSLGHRPFTTLVQADGDAEFLRERPWHDVPPREVVLLWGAELDASTLEGRLALFRHLAAEAPDATIRVVGDSEAAALANEAFLEIVRAMAPALPIRMVPLGSLATEAAPERVAA